jgi:hypothetical protein
MTIDHRSFDSRTSFPGGGWPIHISDHSAEARRKYQENYDFVFRPCRCETPPDRCWKHNPEPDAPVRGGGEDADDHPAN